MPRPTRDPSLDDLPALRDRRAGLMKDLARAQRAHVSTGPLVRRLQEATRAELFAYVAARKAAATRARRRKRRGDNDNPDLFAAA